MVVFTCNHCGDTLQKPKVAKHYQFRCRKPEFVTCADCLTDFRGEEYVAHTKCVTEAERYGGKDYVPKANANKGERKQQEWICVINNLLNDTTNLSSAEKNLLNTLSKYENIPRKKAKFLNFIKNAMGYRVNMTVVESIWIKMENAHKQSQPTTKQSQEDKKEEADIHVNVNTFNNNHQENIVDNQNNENICKEHDSVHHESDINEINRNKEDEIHTVTKKKSKKRQLTESVETQIEQPSAKNKRSSVLMEANICEDRVKQSVSFHWKLTILDIIRSKGEMSLKKLQKKAIALYLLHSTKVVERPKVIAKFQKKLKKIPEISVSGNMVKLIKQSEQEIQTESENTVR